MVTRTYAELDIATLLDEHPVAPDELCSRVGADREAFSLLLRCGERMGLHRVDPVSGLLKLTRLGEQLSARRTPNLRAAALLNGSDYRYQPWGELTTFVRTGSGEGLSPTWRDGTLPFLKSHPEDLHIFQEAMRDLSDQNEQGEDENRSISRGIDFGRFTSIADVGGGCGALLGAILKAHPGRQGTLLDMEEVIAPIRETLSLERIDSVAVDFFEKIPSGYDAYLLKNVLHNHPLKRLAALFSNLRAALLQSGPSSRVFLCELIRSRRHAFTDLNLNLLVGGRIRSVEEYQEILGEHGLNLNAIHRPRGISRVVMEVSAGRR